MQLTQRQIDYCMECGVCTGSCPISKIIPEFSPRQMIKRTLMQPMEELLQSRELWACLSCARCSERCPVEIDFPTFIRLFREKARNLESLPLESHHGILQSVAQIQAFGDTKQKRTVWAEGVGEFAETGDVLYFVGCLPYFDVTFRYLNITPTDGAKNVLRLLNKAGVTPAIRNDECCCGHDALWSGQVDVFQRLAEKNIEMIRKSGAKKVLFSCPEGYMTFKRDYPKHFGELGFEVQHLTEFLAEKISEKNISFTNGNPEILTYQDPCRLGRWENIYDAPRNILEAIPGIELKEMGRSRENTLCCGTSAWMECSSCSKAQQVERLEEAKATGATCLITACPKCQIHFICAQENTDVNMSVVDIYTYLANRLA